MNNYRGKNGRLPARPGEPLNQRLDAGETGDPLLEWLNALPAMPAMPDRKLAGHPIRQQYLSPWRVGVGSTLDPTTGTAPTCPPTSPSHPDRSQGLEPFRVRPAHH
jgi:hypothetical protein